MNPMPSFYTQLLNRKHDCISILANEWPTIYLHFSTLHIHHFILVTQPFNQPSFQLNIIFIISFSTTSFLSTLYSTINESRFEYIVWFRRVYDQSFVNRQVLMNDASDTDMSPLENSTPRHDHMYSDSYLIISTTF